MTIVPISILFLFLAGSAAAQEPPPAPQPPPPGPAAPVAPSTPAPATVVPAPGAAPQVVSPFVHLGQDVEPINVRYEIVIRDEGGAEPGTKTVSMTATLGSVSSVRAQGSARGRASNPLNVDVVPISVRDGKVHTRISIEYVPQAPDPAQPIAPLSVRQTVHVWLNPGTRTVVSESTDPNSDRRLTVVVSSTVLE